MTKTSLGLFLLALLGALGAGVAPDNIGSVRPRVGPTAAHHSPFGDRGPATAPSGDYYKIVRAQYVSIAGNLGTFNTTCYLTNTSTQSVTLLQAYVLGPGGATTVLATYNGLFGVTLPPAGQVRLQIDSGTIAGITPETSVGGNGVKSVIVGWTGSENAVELNAVIERNDGGNTSGRAFVSLVGVPLVL